MKTIEWASGLFEGEGCITNNGSKPKLSLAMTDLDAVQEFVKVMGYGNVREKKDRGSREAHWKQTYEWAVCKRSEVKRMLEMMLPHLCERRAYKALNCLDDIDNYYLN